MLQGNWACSAANQIAHTIVAMKIKTHECKLFDGLIAGGMLVMKLDTKDLQFERMDPFDGTMAYAQNKRQQVIMTEKWAEKHKEIFFSSMHPGKILVIKTTPDIL